MKLIIEVDKKYYEACKDAVSESYPSQIEEVIANGTPYNPSGDAISRSALKKAIFNDLGLGDEENGADVEYMSGLQDCYNLIDNAQTIPLPNEQIAWEQGYECGYHQAKEDVIRRIKEQYNAHHELIPDWLSIGDTKGGAEE